MTDKQILDIFYSQIVKEAQNGKIDCYFTLNIAFDLIINNQKISKCENIPYEGIIIPNLKISNQELFDKLLIQYVKKAIENYSAKDFSFLEDLDLEKLENKEELKKIYLIKYIISTLLANASYTDFNNPIKFLEERINMFDHKIVNDNNEIELGYISSIKARLFFQEEVSSIKSETPYRINSYLLFDDGYKLILPEIYAGNTGTKYILYGIQKTFKNSNLDEREYLKQIRKGFVSKINGAPEHYFIATMLFLSLCSDKEIEVVPFLVERWNAKKIAINNITKNNSTISLEQKEEEQELIQNNITNILIRYFTKLEDASNGINFTSIPFETDDRLCIHIANDFQSKSIAFNEIYELTQNLKNRHLHNI